MLNLAALLHWENIMFEICPQENGFTEGDEILVYNFETKRYTIHAVKSINRVFSTYNRETDDNRQTLQIILEEIINV